MMFAGDTIFGFSVSLTVTVKLQTAELPAPSVAVQVTVVVPRGNAVPDGGLQVTLTLSVLGQPPCVVAVNVTTAEHWPGSLLVRILEGQKIETGVQSA
jgi:hypothetical protein